MKPTLRTISSELPDPPYPADTKANGYNVEFDIQRIRVSDTWILAKPEERPWLLMIWFEAWSSVPVGSMPKDMEVFAARIGCSPEFLQAHAKTLLRGWKPHADDRLYHSYIVESVLEMKRRRQSATERMRKHREKKCDASPNVTDVSQNVTYAKEQEQEQEQDKQTKKIGVGSRATRAKQPPPPDVDAELWDEFLKLRIKLKAPNSDRAMKLLDTEMAKVRAETGESFQAQIERSLLNGWKSVYPRKRDEVKPAKPADENRMRGRLFENGEWVDEKPIAMKDLMAKARARQAT